MSIHFETLQVADVRVETADCVSISFLIPTHLKTIFQFTQGQYLTLRTSIDGEEVRRCYSICSSPLDNELRIAIKKVADGIFSTYANEKIKKGDLLDVMTPIGKFNTPLEKDAIKQYVGFAAGSGITPLLSIIKTTLQTELKSSFTLVYGNRNRQSILFKEELESLKNTYIDRFSVLYLLSREKTDVPIHFGRINAKKCTLLFEHYIQIDAIDTFFLCGPEEMILSVKKVLIAQGVEEKNIYFELFTTAGAEQKKRSNVKPKTNILHQQQSMVTVKMDGVSHEFGLGFDGEAILDAAIQQGVDLPYACKGGVCCTCRAKLVIGDVEMDVNYGLEPVELAQGFILTCQSHPRSGKVVVDFDIK